MTTLAVHRTTAVAAVLALLALASLAIGPCGGSDVKAVDAEDWVDDLCDATADFENENEDLLEDLFDTDFSKRGARDDMIDYLDAVRDAFKAYRSEVEKLGKPDLDSGDEVRKALFATFDKFEDELKEARSEIRKLKEGDDFQEDVDEVFDELDEGDGFEERLNDLADERDTRDAEDIIDLINEDSACSGSLFSF